MDVIYKTPQVSEAIFLNAKTMDSIPLTGILLCFISFQRDALWVSDRE
jgi:hypothetical protein